MQFLPSRSERVMVVALFVPSCVVVVDAGWKKERASEEKGKAEVLFEVAIYSRRKQSRVRLSARNLISDAWKSLVLIERDSKFQDGLHGKVLRKYRNYTTNFWKFLRLA